jgi:hypothetical protein
MILRNYRSRFGHAAVYWDAPYIYFSSQVQESVRGYVQLVMSVEGGLC